MRIGLSSIVPAAGISVINADPVVQQLKNQGMGRLGMRASLGCGNGSGQTIPWQDAFGGYQLMGRDVNFQSTPLSGLGDWVPGAFSSPENPVLRGYERVKGNALAGQLAGLNGIDTSSFAGFMNSLTSGSGDIIPGVSDLLVVGGAAVLLVMLLGSKGRR